MKYTILMIGSSSSTYGKDLLILNLLMTPLHRFELLTVSLYKIRILFKICSQGIVVVIDIEEGPTLHSELALQRSAQVSLVIRKFIEIS